LSITPVRAVPFRGIGLLSLNAANRRFGLSRV